MAARPPLRSGVEILLQALPRILERYPDARALRGRIPDVLAEEAYAARLLPRIRVYEERGQWRFLGVLDAAQMAAFYPNLDVIAVPSLNSTVVRPGTGRGDAGGRAKCRQRPPRVRQPVLQTGMGDRTGRRRRRSRGGYPQGHRRPRVVRTASTRNRGALLHRTARPWTTKCSSSNCWSANGADTATRVRTDLTRVKLSTSTANRRAVRPATARSYRRSHPPAGRERPSTS